MNEITLTPECEQVLRGQVITDEQPGPILRDFQVILDFVGDRGVEAGGKHHLLPMKFIGELDRRLSRPLNLRLKRPQVRSHPYLQGLNLVLRASGLSRVEGAGGKARLVLDPEMRMQWEQLNPTEQYFNLLEAWLRFGRPEMVGERGSFWGDQLLLCLQAWRLLQGNARRFDLSKPHEIYFSGIGHDFYVLALMDLFGFVTVERPSPPVAPWRPAGVALTPFGDALFTRLAVAEFKALPERDDDEDVEEPAGEVSILSMRDYLEAEDEDDDDDGVEGEGEDEDEERADGEWNLPRFGEWQPFFQPYFPEWRENLELPGPEARDGVFVFRVSLDKLWRTDRHAGRRHPGRPGRHDPPLRGVRQRPPVRVLVSQPPGGRGHGRSPDDG